MGAGGISGSGKVIKSSLKESIGFESMLGEGKVFRERWFVRGKASYSVASARPVLPSHIVEF